MTPYARLCSCCMRGTREWARWRCCARDLLAEWRSGSPGARCARPQAHRVVHTFAPCEALAARPRARHAVIVAGVHSRAIHTILDAASRYTLSCFVFFSPFFHLPRYVDALSAQRRIRPR